MTTSPPQSKTGRAFARPAAVSVNNTHHWRLVKRGGLRAWLEVAGNLVELAQRDPERGVRYLETWTRQMRRGMGHSVRLASPGGNHQ